MPKAWPEPHWSKPLWTTGRTQIARPSTVVEDDRIVDYKLRLPEQKREAVAAFKKLNYRVIAAGDSFNDTTMLIEADAGFLFHAPDNVKQLFPQFEALEDYDTLLQRIRGALSAD